MNILVSGSVAYDRIMDFPGRFSDHILPDKIHVLNVCFLVNGITEKFGGTAGNIAYSLALLGECPTILATSGNDFARYEEWLDKLGTSRRAIKKVDDLPTACAYITTDKSDNQITGFNLGAMAAPCGFDPAELDPADTIAIVAPGNLEDMVNFCARYRELGIRYIADPGQNITALSGEQLAAMASGAEILISNDYELELIEKATGLSLPELLERAGAVITTLGEHGSIVRAKGQEITIPPAPVQKALDPTGAGDAFRSGLIKGLVAGRPLVEAAQMGSVSAAYAVEHYGTQEHVYSLEEYWARYNKVFA